MSMYGHTGNWFEAHLDAQALERATYAHAVFLAQRDASGAPSSDEATAILDAAGAQSSTIPTWLDRAKGLAAGLLEVRTPDRAFAH